METPKPLDGPVIEAKRRFSIDHPEYGSVSLPAGIYSINTERGKQEILPRNKNKNTPIAKS